MDLCGSHRGAILAVDALGGRGRQWCGHCRVLASAVSLSPGTTCELMVKMCHVFWFKRAEAVLLQKEISCCDGTRKAQRPMADSFPNVKRHVHCGFCLQEFDGFVVWFAPGDAG